MKFFPKKIQFFMLVAPLMVSMLNATTNQLPKLVIKKIINNTGHDLIIIDRLSKKTKEIPANKTAEINLQASNKNVIIQGSMKDAMAQEAQYVIKKNHGAPDDEAYLHVTLTEGGVNDGSGMIMGKLGSVILKFLLAGKNGGCQMSTNTLKRANTSLVETAITLSLSKRALKENIFGLDAEYTLEENNS